MSPELILQQASCIPESFGSQFFIQARSMTSTSDLMSATCWWMFSSYLPIVRSFSFSLGVMAQPPSTNRPGKTEAWARDFFPWARARAFCPEKRYGSVVKSTPLPEKNIAADIESRAASRR